MEAVQNKERRNVSRRFHRKSRNSCIPCRQRRVRCNLQPPICANCHRRNEPCSYKQDGTQKLSLALLDSNTATKHSKDGDAPGITVPWGIATFDSNSHSEEGMYGVRQLAKEPSSSWVIEFMEKTFFLSGLTTSDRATLLQEFDRQASAFKYVHRTITALHALHESCQGSSHPSLQAAAYQNHIEASILFRKSQAQVNEGNWMAILMFGIGVIVFQFAEALNTSNEADGYLQVLHVLRSSVNLGSEVAPYLLASPLMRFTGPRLSQLKLPLDEFTWNAICRLDSLDYPKDTPDTTRCACLHSIAALKEWVIMVEGHPRNWRHFIDWPAAVSVQFLTALSNKYPVALIVFIYWCSIMHHSPKRWYMVGWADRAANAAMKQLGEEWDYILEFPRNMLMSESTSHGSFRLALINT
ncbi:hypothetical protein F4776DRAFT_665428 [Hypoxylon sp. NC0597]|nr:hypothetical protein F4776DRAFT_665428 [Hypoxylon sp. NC0597]